MNVARDISSLLISIIQVNGDVDYSRLIYILPGNLSGNDQGRKNVFHQMFKGVGIDRTPPSDVTETREYLKLA